MNNIIKTLKKYGLSENEVKVYITLLKLVEASAYQIAQNAVIPRTSTYTALEKLEAEGLVFSSLKNNIRCFSCENPNKFTESLEEKKKMILDVIPDLSNLINTATVLPTVKLFKGKDGYIKARREMLEDFKRNKIKQIFVISSPLDFDLFPKYFPAWIEERKKMRVTSKIFLRHDSQFSEHFQSNQMDMREAKYLPINLKFDGTMNIYGKKIAFFSLKENELNSIIIDSSALAEMMWQFLNFTWSLVKT